MLAKCSQKLWWFIWLKKPSSSLLNKLRMHDSFLLTLIFLWKKRRSLARDAFTENDSSSFLPPRHQIAKHGAAMRFLRSRDTGTFLPIVPFPSASLSSPSPVTRRWRQLCCRVGKTVGELHEHWYATEVRANALFIYSCVLTYNRKKAEKRPRMSQLVARVASNIGTGMKILKYLT